MQFRQFFQVIAQPAPAVRAAEASPTPLVEVVVAESFRRADPSLPVATRLHELPHNLGVLTERGGRIGVPDADRAVLAIMEQDAKSAFTLWLNRSGDLSVVLAAERLARQEGFVISGRMEVTADLLRTLYDPSAVPAVATAGAGQGRAGVEAAFTYRGEKDEIFDEIVVRALELGASDIHLSVPRDEATQVAYRVNGDMTLSRQFSPAMGVGLVNAMYTFADARAKSATQYDANSFQTARITREVTVEKVMRRVSLRYSGSPVFPGESSKIVLRVIPHAQRDGSRPYIPLPELGYSAAHQREIARWLTGATGLIMMAGSTGSGKSRTLQTMIGLLHEKYAGRRNIMTIEDPPEYAMPAGVHQVTVPSGNTFGDALREVMRQDPDVIMVGEVRDEETAQLLQRALNTGHKCLSTVHASSACAAIDRLIDLGFERAVLSMPGNISGVVYQRLVQVLCPACRVPMAESADATPALVARLELVAAGRSLTDVFFRNHADRCPSCRNGIVGRTVAAEMVSQPDLEMLEWISAGDRTSAAMHWRSGGTPGVASTMGVAGVTALDHAIEKMLAGTVSPVDVEDMRQLGSEVSRSDAASWIAKHRIGGRR